MADNDLPTNHEELARCLADPHWRLTHLYKIVAKEGNEDGADLVVTFDPNASQWQLLRQLHYRNDIVKARQMGITTLACILFLDTALFNKGPVTCAIIAHNLEAAEKIFRTKVKFAYDNLPDVLRERFPTIKDSSSELLFEHNGASLSVSTSVRSGTTHRLHVSEYGKICAKYPDKAKEIQTGSFPSVPSSGIIIVESTTEGQEGHFYEMTMAAKAHEQSGRPLTARDWKLHFFAWWEAPEYRMDPKGVLVTAEDGIYFAKVEAVTGRRLSPEQRAWYVTTLRNDFANEPPLMWQEYPSYLDEAFQRSTDGCYYAVQLANARIQGRIVDKLPHDGSPVNTFWDLGRSDFTAIWFHQRVGPWNHFIKYYENRNYDLDHYAKVLEDTGWIFGRHFLPHEADYRRQGESADNNPTMREMLQKLLPTHRFHVVPRVTNLLSGINATRRALGSCRFDESGTRDGLVRVGSYRKRWDKGRATWDESTDVSDDNAHAADALRQFGQVLEGGEAFSGLARPAGSRPSGGSLFKRRGSGMAV